MLIRWLASEIRIFAYFKNVILIAAVVGLGIGCSLGVLVGVMLLSGLIVLVRLRLDLGSLLSYSQFFFLGAGFLLMETRAMLAVSILFGTTWIVNSIVIAIVLLMTLLANHLVMKMSTLKEWHGYLALFLTLLVLYLVPLSQFAGAGIAVKLLISAAILGLPFTFSGIVFSRALSKVNAPERALGINILGALLGGCLEYSSMIIGTNGLTVLSIGLYAISFMVAIGRLQSKIADKAG